MRRAQVGRGSPVAAVERHQADETVRNELASFSTTVRVPLHTAEALRWPDMEVIERRVRAEFSAAERRGELTLTWAALPAEERRSSAAFLPPDRTEVRADGGAFQASPAKTLDAESGRLAVEESDNAGAELEEAWAAGAHEDRLAWFESSTGGASAPQVSR